MERKLQFPYGKYLASNEHFNKLLIRYIWEKKSIKSFGFGGIDMDEDFPEIVDLVKNISQVDWAFNNVLVKLDRVDMATFEVSSHQPEFLTLRFLYKQKLKKSSKIDGVLKGVLNMYFSIDDENISFNVQDPAFGDKVE